MKNSYSPIADKKAQVVIRNVRFTILTSRIIRMEYAPSMTFEDNASLVVINRKLPIPSFSSKIINNILTVETDFFILNYSISDEPFTNTTLNIKLKNNKLVKHYHKDYYKYQCWKPGLIDPFNLKGTTRTLDETNGEETLTLDDGLISPMGWYFLDDSNTPLLDKNLWVMERIDIGQQDWYFFAYGDDYKSILNDFTLISGKISLPPRFAFGYWWSRYWTYSDYEIRELVTDFKNHNLPLDVCVIDMDWHETHGLTAKKTQYDQVGERIGWTGYTWNKNLFPQPENLTNWLHHQDIKVALNLHPASGISPLEKAYQEFIKEYVQNPKPNIKEIIPFCIEEKKWVEAFFKTVIAPLEKQGIDFWWLDWQSWLKNKKIEQLDNTWWINHVFFTEKQKQSRGLLFHRWGGLGNQRYQIGFSGDTQISWESLAFQPYFTATAGNVGYGYWSHDIGGHMGEPPSAELYLRWLQFGAYSPILRTHASKNKAIERKIWMYPEVYPMLRKTMLLRRELIPYIYTQARLAYDQGVSICRPLYWEYPNSKEAYQKDQYFFGNDMMIHPITEPLNEFGFVRKTTWIPQGVWFDTVTGNDVVGPKKLTQDYTLEEIPVFIKKGSIVTKMLVSDSLYKPLSKVILDVYPGEYGVCNLYEDDGVSEEYRLNNYSFTKIEQSQLGNKIILTIHPLLGKFPHSTIKRSWQINLIRCICPVKILINHSEVILDQNNLSYNGMKLTVTFLPESVHTNEKTIISFLFDNKVFNTHQDFNQIILFNHRLKSVLESIKNEINRLDAFANPPELLLAFSTLPTRISYYPLTLFKELKFFKKNYLNLLITLINYPGICLKTLNPIFAKLNINNAFSFDTDIVLKPYGCYKCKVSFLLDSNLKELRYTLDGSIPNHHSNIYEKPFYIKKTALITACHFEKNKVKSFPVQKIFVSQWAQKVNYLYPCSLKYSGKDNLSLVSGNFGNIDDYHQNWIGFEEVDPVITIEFIKELTVKEISVRFLQDNHFWIFGPKSLVFKLSQDGLNFQEVFKKTYAISEKQDKNDPRIISIIAEIKPSKKAKYLRIHAENIKVCPSWHKAKGKKSWIFIDQIMLST